MIKNSYFVILNSFQDNAKPSPVILNRVQDDDILCGSVVSRQGQS